MWLIIVLTLSCYVCITAYELTLNSYVCKTAMFVQFEIAMWVQMTKENDLCSVLITNAMFETEENDWHWTAMFVQMLLIV